MNTVEEIKDSLLSRLDSLGIEGVDIENVILDPENDVVNVEFCDDNDDCVTVSFGFDEEENPYALIIADEDNDSLCIDLSPLEPTVDEGDSNEYYLDLVDSEWLNYSTFKTILTSGHIMANNESSGSRIEEVVYQKVVRGGKVVKVPVVLRKKRLTPKQKAALMKARKKSHTSGAMKNRKKSLTIRKRSNL